MDKKLSVIIANRNDTAMLSVTINSCIEELLPIGHDKSEIIICDNSDQNIYNQLASVLPTGYMQEHFLKVFRQDFPCLFTARETAIKEAQGEYIVCIDSHMIIGRGMFVDLLNFMEARNEDSTMAFAHAPINWSHHHAKNARHDRDMSVNELGNWNKVYGNERTITWKGMPWICRKNFWNDIGGYGALSQHKISWGGGDMHIGIKPWLLGYKNWAVPCRPAIHIGPFPKIDKDKDPNSVRVSTGPGDGYRYRLWADSGTGPHTLGFLISCYILGGEPMMHRNEAAITERFGRYLDVKKWWNKAIEYGKDEKAWLDAHKIMTFEQLLETKPWDN